MSANARAELDVNGLVKRFGGVTAVNNVSFRVSAGDVVGLIGPNGAGKSTILAMLSGFLRPDEGDVRFCGKDITRAGAGAIARAGISRTFQQATPLAGMSVLENVAVGMHTRYRSSLASVLFRTPRMRREERTMLDHAAQLLQDFGLDIDLNTDAADLTFGHLRMLEMARSIAMEPSILLLDEPAAGLNHVETGQLATTIKRACERGVGVLLVDHDVPFVFELAASVVVMDFGRVISSGTASQVYADPAVRAAYLGSSERTASQ